MAEDAVWESNFEQLIAYYNKTRATLPLNWEEAASQRRAGTAPPPKGTPLRSWVDKQRQLYRHGELDIKRQQRLQETGLQLTLKGKLREVDWETMVGRLKSFYMLHGHCRVHEHGLSLSLCLCRSLPCVCVSLSLSPPHRSPLPLSLSVSLSCPGHCRVHGHGNSLREVRI